VLGQRVRDVEEIGRKVVRFVVHLQACTNERTDFLLGDDPSMREADFERLYAEHAQRLFGFLVYRTGDRALAEDLVADTFEAAFRARSRFDRRRASERTWLYTIALNLLRDQGRRRSAQARAYERSTAAGDGLDDPSLRELERVVERERIMRSLAVLSEQERECVALRFGSDLSLKEIAAALCEPVTTVEGRLYRALRKLRDALGP
jgi:RNA polymerase sigma-70 factor (ECF subfamily)